MLHSYNSVEDILGVDGDQSMANAAEVQDVRVTSTPYPGRCRYGSVRRLDIGCKTPDRMEFATSCSDETPSGKIFGKFFFFFSNFQSNDRISLLISFQSSNFDEIINRAEGSSNK